MCSRFTSFFWLSRAKEYESQATQEEQEPMVPANDTKKEEEQEQEEEEEQAVQRKLQSKRPEQRRSPPPPLSSRSIWSALITRRISYEAIQRHDQMFAPYHPGMPAD